MVVPMSVSVDAGLCWTLAQMGFRGGVQRSQVHD